MTDPNGRRQAAVFSGGGAYGAYAVGVYKTLATGGSPGTGHRPLQPEIFTGTSAGAFNAGVLVASSSAADPVARLEQVWRDRVVVPLPSLSNSICRFRPDPTRWLDVPRLLRDPRAPLRDAFEDTTFLSRVMFQRGIQFIQAAGPVDHRALEALDLTLLFSPRPFHNLVGSAIDFTAIRASSWRLIVAATNWITGRVQLFSNHLQEVERGAAMLNDDLGPKAILASAAIPGIFAPVEIGGVPYVDGGVLMNSPLKPAIDAGGDVLHVIQMEPDMSSIPPTFSSLDTIYRMLVINNNANLDRDLETCAEINRTLGEASANPDHRPVEVHRYRPSEPLRGILGLLDFSKPRVERLIALGERDAREHDCRSSGCVLVAGQRALGPAPKRRRAKTTASARMRAGGSAGS